MEKPHWEVISLFMKLSGILSHACTYYSVLEIILDNQFGVSIEPLFKKMSDVWKVKKESWKVLCERILIKQIPFKSYWNEFSNI